MAVKVNCIFQGGGANLATLLCAVEALGQLQEEGFLTVNGVAGTSAGSLAAACFAHPKPNAELIERIVNVSNKHLVHFKLPNNRLSLAYKVLSGEPFIKAKTLENTIREFFRIDDRTSFKFEDAQCPLYICASDIKRSKTVIFNAASDTSLEKALANSCAIPFVFRGFKDESDLADGGVMANLLDQSVFAESTAHALAFSFETDEMTDYDGILSFANTVVGSMMNNAVNETKIRILQSGGYVCELPSKFGTLSFEEALKKLQEDRFRREVVEQCKSKIRSGLENFVNQTALLSHGDQLKHLQYLSSKLLNEIKTREPYKVTEGAIVCEANSLFDKSDPRSRSPDRQIKRVVIEPTGSGLQMFRIGIARGFDFKLTKEISCSVYDGKGNELDAIVEVATSTERKDGVDEPKDDQKEKLLSPSDEATENSDNCEKIYRLCVVLKEWQSSDNGPFTITTTTTHQKPLMGGLAKPEGNEWMRVQAHRDDEIEQQDFILLIPKDFRKLHLSDLMENVRRCSAGPENLTSEETDWIKGQEMSTQELEAAKSWLQPGAAFRYVGWRTCNVTGHCSTGVLIEQDIGD